MSQVVTFEDFTPPARYDDTPWTSVQILEATESDGDYTLIDTITLDPVDADPSDPASRNFSTSLASDTVALWYELIWVDGGLATSSPSAPIQNIPFDLFASVDDLFRILKKTGPSAAQISAATRDLAVATGEILSEIDLAADAAPLSGWQLALCETVCLDRAADLWRHRESAPGILGIVDEGVPTTPGRYSWARYAARLSPIKDQWGIA